MSVSQPERAWYQDGCLVLVILMMIVGVGGPVYFMYQEDQKLTPFPMYTGKVEYQLLGPHLLHIRVWHQCPGDLKNGILTVSARSGLLVKKTGYQEKYHSFESWSPNEENVVEFEFPLREFGPDQEVSIEISMEARNAKPSHVHDIWHGADWKSNQ